MKRPYIFIFLLLFLSCETELDLSRVDGEPCIYMSALIGNSPESEEIVLYAMPCIPVSAEDTTMLEASVTLSGTAADYPISFNESKDNDYSSIAIYSLGFRQDIRPGDRIEIKASAKGFPSAEAVTVVPDPIRLINAEIVEKQGSFITFEIVYEEDEDEDGYYGIMFNDINISEVPGFTMSETYDMVISGYFYRDILIWDNHKVTKEDGKVRFRTYVDTRTDRDMYDVTIFSFSRESFMYLRGKHIKSSNFPSIGMGTPAFTYSNVIGGTGVVGSWWATETQLKYTE